MTDRHPGKPTGEFTKSIGITRWPKGVSIFFEDGAEDGAGQHFEIEGPSAKTGRLVTAEIDAQASPIRGDSHIRGDIHNLLVTQFGATSAPGYVPPQRVIVLASPNAQGRHLQR